MTLHSSYEIDSLKDIFIEYLKTHYLSELMSIITTEFVNQENSDVYKEIDNPANINEVIYKFLNNHFPSELMMALETAVNEDEKDKVSQSKYNIKNDE